MNAVSEFRGSFLRSALTLLAGFSFLPTSPPAFAETLRQDQADFTPPFPAIARLGKAPDWSALDDYQGTITREEFTYLLNHCYARSPEDSAGHIRIQQDRALILKQSNFPELGWYDLRFRTDDHLSTDGPRFWRRPTEIDDLPANSTKPLEGLRIAIDPGHIGGKWVTWDDRHFLLGKDTIPVKEGEMTLIVARLLERDLTLLGATVYLTRESNNPTTTERVETLQEEARTYLTRRGQIPSPGLIASTAKAMFAISSEIRSRGEILNGSIRPDLALCLHFDASPWGGKPAFRSPNHLHLLINGCYSRSEIAEDDTRFEMTLRILQRIYYEELALSDIVSKTMQKETRLPAFHYDGKSGMSVNDNELVWARNLLANRVFSCPVLFFEPFCMNHRETHLRVQEGPYDGLREINGIYRKNIYQEYADGVTSGLIRYYRKKR